MDCSLIEERLVAYHLATVEDEEREAIDAHLLGCTECLRGYLRLKHELERGARIKPSASLRARLRADVERVVRPTGLARVQMFLSRPIPLYQGFAAAAAIAIVVAAALVLPGKTTNEAVDANAIRPGATQRIDTARESSASLSLY
jgi:anti-sigma factor RsiW